MIFRKFICVLFGCKSICLFSHHWGTQDGTTGSQSTGWVCERCGKQRTEQWDT